jgi:hypothetical protein
MGFSRAQDYAGRTLRISGEVWIYVGIGLDRACSSAWTSRPAALVKNTASAPDALPRPERQVCIAAFTNQCLLLCNVKLATVGIWPCPTHLPLIPPCFAVSADCQRPAHQMVYNVMLGHTESGSSTQSNVVVFTQAFFEAYCAVFGV